MNTALRAYGRQCTDVSCMNLLNPLQNVGPT